MFDWFILGRTQIVSYICPMLDWFIFAPTSSLVGLSDV